MHIRTRKNVLLIELIIVILFFGISAAITLQVYSMAHLRSQDSGDITYALLVAQDWADRVSVSDDPEGMLAENGWVPRDGDFRLAADGRYEVVLSLSREETDAGVLTVAEVSVYNSAREDDPHILTLPSEIYRPRSGVGG